MLDRKAVGYCEYAGRGGENHEIGLKIHEKVQHWLNAMNDQLALQGVMLLIERPRHLQVD